MDRRPLRQSKRGQATHCAFTFSTGVLSGRTFDLRRVDTRVVLNAVEDWEFINTGSMDHLVHIHTNPFQILGADGQPEAAWRDSVLVGRGDRRRIRVRFADFTGKTVYHCHILDHEDRGMMGVLEITDPTG